MKGHWIVLYVIGMGMIPIIRAMDHHFYPVVPIELSANQQVVVNEIHWPAKHWSAKEYDLLLAIRSVALSHDGKSARSFALSHDGKSGVPRFQELADHRMQTALRKQRELPASLVREREQLQQSRPMAPKLAKGKYESSTAFKARVVKTKADYSQQVAQYNQSIDSLQIRIHQFIDSHRNTVLSEQARNQIIRDAFLDVFGNPILSSIRYDADTQTFFVDLTSDSPVAKKFKRTLAIAPVANDIAQQFEQNLRHNAPEIIFNIGDDGTVSWKQARIKIKQKQYAMIPTDINFKPVPMQTQLAAADVQQIDLSGMQIKGDAAAGIKVNLSQDPEIAKLQKRLYAQRQHKAQTEAKQQEMARLQAAITRLQQAQGASSAPNSLTKRLMAALPAAAHRNHDAVAVVIGNRNYHRWHQDLPDVRYAHNDARLIKRYLLHSLGYREANVIFLEDATQAQLTSTFGSASNPKGKLYNRIRARKSDLFVYYSGHGVPGLNDNQGYLLPVDADPATAELNGYALSTLYTNLAKLPVRSLTVALDACFSGSSAGGAVVKNASPALLRVTEQRRLLPKKTVLLTAAASTEVASWDKDAHLGLFTRYLVEGVEGKADGNRDGTVTLHELKSYLGDAVPNQARRRYNREQHPQIHGPSRAVLAQLK